MGQGKLGKIPKEIAKFLQLDNVDTYTGHAFRRTSATLIVDEGANMEILKRHGVWASNTVAEGYINDSVRSKKAITKLMSSAINFNEKENTPVKKKVETVTSGSLNGLTNSSSDVGLQVATSTNSFAGSSSHWNEKLRTSSHQSLRTPNLTEYQYRPKASLNIHNVAPNLNQFQYKAKTSTKKVLRDENVNPNQFIPHSSTPVKLTQVKCDEYENITQEELQEVVSTDFYQYLPSKSQNSESLNNRSTTKILAEIENITQAELEEVVSTQFEVGIQHLDSINKTQKEIQMSEDNFDGITQEEFQEVVSTAFPESKPKQCRPIYIFENCNVYFNRK